MPNKVVPIRPPVKPDPELAELMQRSRMIGRVAFGDKPLIFDFSACLAEFIANKAKVLRFPTPAPKPKANLRPTRPVAASSPTTSNLVSIRRRRRGTKRRVP